jgi:acylphosphatase
VLISVKKGQKMSNTNQRLHAIVYGMVQGVSFRYYTTRKANELAITGWVMNRRDGRSVEVMAEGERDKLDQLHEWLHEGSPDAQVERVEAEWETATGEFTAFRTRYWHGRNQDDGQDDSLW